MPIKHLYQWWTRVIIKIAVNLSLSQGNEKSGARVRMPGLSRILTKKRRSTQNLRQQASFSYSAFAH